VRKVSDIRGYEANSNAEIMTIQNKQRHVAKAKNNVYSHKS